MEKELEGKSLDQLIEVACQELGCIPEDLELEILEFSSSSGLLGIPGKKIRIKARIKTDKVLSERANRALMFLKELLNYADFKIDVKANILKDKMQVEILLSGEDIKYLIQNGAEPLTALEFLTNKVVARSLGVGPKIVLKLEGIDIEKEKKLVNAVRRAIEKIKTNKEPQIIKISSQREQRIVVNIIKQEENIDYKIEGEGKQKKVILNWKE
uniref:RNA-binding protein KhpB N-terminal domain-containing protein n=1 Tax=Thermodesulfobacterium geofontis TaxID=1295609 RepID=A0A7C4JRQ7_9BACT